MCQLKTFVSHQREPNWTLSLITINPRNYFQGKLYCDFLTSAQYLVQKWLLIFNRTKHQMQSLFSIPVDGGGRVFLNAGPTDCAVVFATYFDRHLYRWQVARVKCSFYPHQPCIAPDNTTCSRFNFSLLLFQPKPQQSAGIFQGPVWEWDTAVIVNAAMVILASHIAPSNLYYVVIAWLAFTKYQHIDHVRCFEAKQWEMLVFFLNSWAMEIFTLRR